MISIIIPACNEEKYIGKTIKSIRKQKYKNYEIIVVCNGCTDKTFKISKKEADKVLKFKWRNISKAKNEGAKIAKYETLFFLDADTELIGKVLEEISKKDIIIGTCKSKPDIGNIKNNILINLKNNVLSPILKMPHGNTICSKKYFNGFDETLKKGEDRKLIREVLKKTKSKFTILNTKVKACSRRYRILGYLTVIKYWTKEKLNPTNINHPVVR